MLKDCMVCGEEFGPDEITINTEGAEIHVFAASYAPIEGMGSIDGESSHRLDGKDNRDYFGGY
jgi:hypothetical protein